MLRHMEDPKFPSTANDLEMVEAVLREADSVEGDDDEAEEVRDAAERLRDSLDW